MAIVPDFCMSMVIGSDESEGMVKLANMGKQFGEQRLQSKQNRPKQRL